MDDRSLTELEVVIPNLHWRYSGVTATNRMVAPRLARLFRAAWLGRDRPAGIIRLTLGDLLRLRRRGSHLRIWHARRNNEMIAGVLLRALGWRFALVFTSAAQRHHTWITRFLIGRMDAVIATSEAAAGYLQKPAVVIQHGIDTELYRPPPDRAAAFASTGLPGKFAIGCFGRVRPQKGTDVFVEAMCRLLPKFPDFTAVVIGAVTPDQQAFAHRLLEQVKTAGLADRVRILGELPMEEVPRWYQRMAIYAFTSRNEGFGLTLLEAMSAGVAVIATRAGIAEKLITGREIGILIPPGDAEALTAALEALMRDPERAAAMGQRSREHVMAKFGVDAEAEKIAGVYREVLQSCR